MNRDIYNIYNINPSTIICLLVRHHRKTKMETHQITDFFIYFSNQTCPTFVFLVFSALFFFGFSVSLFLSPGSDSSAQPATLQYLQGEVSSTALAMFYRSDLARQGGSGWDGKVPRCQGAGVLWLVWLQHQIWEPVWIMWKVTVKGLWIMKPTELSLKRP